MEPGGIIPPADAATLAKKGVARVFTPKDNELNAIVAEIATLVGAATEAEA